jgi:hypothetical protein
LQDGCEEITVKTSDPVLFHCTLSLSLLPSTGGKK